MRPLLGLDTLRRQVRRRPGWAALLGAVRPHSADRSGSREQRRRRGSGTQPVTHVQILTRLVLRVISLRILRGVALAAVVTLRVTAGCARDRAALALRCLHATLQSAPLGIRRLWRAIAEDRVVIRRVCRGGRRSRGGRGWRARGQRVCSNVCEQARTRMSQRLVVVGGGGGCGRCWRGGWRGGWGGGGGGGGGGGWCGALRARWHHLVASGHLTG